QIPPRVSALKQNGVRLYQLTRKGQAVWPSPRPIAVKSISVIEGSGQRWYFEASVGGGTYIRSLVRDWGLLLGHSAHLGGLERTGVGSFAATRAWSLQQLEAMGDQWISALESFESHLSIAVHNLDPGVIPMIAHGRQDVLPHVMGNAEGTIALAGNHDIIAIVTGPPWRFRNVLLKDGAYGAN
ncbi:MAG: tRNA pseudouridine(55) synthase TruB, partial [Firmicutes bacterium]|nr:tRNA pseudouridine(55) synthase TruB [Bacillota bacterium]